MRNLLAFSLVAVASAALLTPSALADFSDDFTVENTLADYYSYFGLNTGVNNDNDAGDGSNAETFNTGEFALDTANGKVDISFPNTSGFKFIRLGRSLDAANQFDLTQPTVITVNASGLDTNFSAGAIQKPMVFGFSAGDVNPEITIQVQNDQFGAFTQINAGYKMPGGSDTPLTNGWQNIPGAPNNKDIVLSIDADSYSLTVGGVTAISDTAHGLTFDASDGMTPMFELRKSFGGASISVNSFAGTGTAVVGLLAGDANGDGQVDGNDLISVEENFGATGDPGIDGDANGDGQVDGNDLISVEENFGATSGAASVPEPASIILLSLAGLGLIRRR